jgi:hypothetical protein
MRTLGLIIIYIFLTSCNNKNEEHLTNNFYTLKKEYEDQRNKLHDEENYQAYMSEWFTYNNENEIDRRNGCYFLGEEVEKIVLVMDKNGTINNVAIENENEMAKCFQKTFFGVTYPKPPFYPFYHLMNMKGVIQSIPGEYQAVTETEYSIVLHLQSDKKSIMKLTAYATNEGESDRDKILNGYWHIIGTKLHLDFGTEGYVDYEIHGCLSFEEFGYDGCGLGLKAALTNTKPYHQLERYSLWRKEVIPN